MFSYHFHFFIPQFFFSKFKRLFPKNYNFMSYYSLYNYIQIVGKLKEWWEYEGTIIHLILTIFDELLKTSLFYSRFNSWNVHRKNSSFPFVYQMKNKQQEKMKNFYGEPISCWNESKINYSLWRLDTICNTVVLSRKY